MQRPPAALGAFFLCVAVAAGAEELARPSLEAREPCAHRDPERRPFFGDLHVHTAYSQDASTQGTRTPPSQVVPFSPRNGA